MSAVWVCTVCGAKTASDCNHCFWCGYSRYVTYQGDLVLRDGPNGYVMRDKQGNVIRKGSENDAETKPNSAVDSASGKAVKP